ncbi:hypothetical protein MJT46_009590 [Ovis ammon polii x Ovis aries]|nr:hypothetical protein MJT46_009590 [Ovis ammon polii x Ovis aries]
MTRHSTKPFQCQDNLEFRKIGENSVPTADYQTKTPSITAVPSLTTRKLTQKACGRTAVLFPGDIEALDPQDLAGGQITAQPNVVCGGPEAASTWPGIERQTAKLQSFCRNEHLSFRALSEIVRRKIKSSSGQSFVPLLFRSLPKPPFKEDLHMQNEQWLRAVTAPHGIFHIHDSGNAGDKSRCIPQHRLTRGAHTADPVRLDVEPRFWVLDFHHDISRMLHKDHPTLAKTVCHPHMITDQQSRKGPQPSEPTLTDDP